LYRDLASNIGIDFKTPEEFFRNEPPESYERIFEPLKFLSDRDDDSGESAVFVKRNPQELVISVGSPGAGKSTFYWETMKPLGYERINQDILKTVSQELRGEH
jgi:bifunctional polynucleotide phosphatase/kinase